MRKILCIISIACIALSSFTLAIMIEPGIIHYYDGIGFLCIVASIICSGLVLPLWIIFASTKSNKNKKVQIIASISFVLYVGIYFDFLHIGGKFIIAQIVLSVIALYLCIKCSKKQPIPTNV
ncbi:MAG: hypothetical protein J1F24_03195 [Oscillospiraceae bacterium]|nr:hypothetical protein [Oscillospiraceae bacterium]